MSGNNRMRISHLNYLNELSPQDEMADNGFIPDDLAMFTNTQFFDFDINPVREGLEQDFTETKSADTKAQQAAIEPSLDFVDYGGFDFTHALTTIPPTISTIDTNPAHFANPAPQFDMDPLSPSSVASPSSGHSPNGSKRKASLVDSTPLNIEEASRLAAEEDKRRRNTAASARFRIKKKQREQALERSAKEMTEKVNSLESRINQLEMENKWLKNLIVEKNGATTKEEIAEILAAKYTLTGATPPKKSS